MGVILNTAVVPTNLQLNTGSNLTFVTATNAGVSSGDHQVFEVALTKPEPFCVIIIQNFHATVAVNYQIQVGTAGNNYWASSTDSPVVSIPAGAIHAIHIEGAKYTKQNSTVSVRCINSSGNALRDMVKVGAIQLT
jgi:hypothetical protein